jgi:thiosulfate reductase/polysulfide reductase chain A
MLLDVMRENYAWINHDEARKLGIQHGDVIEITSRVGSVRIKAYPTKKIVPQTIFYIHGFGAKSDGLSFAHRNGASDNEIIEGEIEPVFGSAIMHETIVTVKKV